MQIRALPQNGFECFQKPSAALILNSSPSGKSRSCRTTRGSTAFCRVRRNELTDRTGAKQIPKNLDQLAPEHAERSTTIRASPEADSFFPPRSGFVQQGAASNSRRAWRYDCH